MSVPSKSSSESPLNALERSVSLSGVRIIRSERGGRLRFRDLGVRGLVRVGVNLCVLSERLTIGVGGPSSSKAVGVV